MTDEGLKKCTSCKKSWEISMYYFYKTRNRYSSQCRICHRNLANRRNQFWRYKVLAHYSTDPPRCECCRETHLEFLSIDHINGGGRAQRQTIKVRWWEWLKKNGYPKGFRVLCHNCNMAYGIYGRCPHKGKRQSLNGGRILKAYDPNAPNKGYKLTKADVKKIKLLIKSGIAQNKIADMYKVSRATICCINGGKRWAATTNS